MILSGARVNTTKCRYCHDKITNVVIVITQTNVLLLRYVNPLLSYQFGILKLQHNWVNWGWQAYTAPKYVFWFSSLCYNFALMSMSCSERPFLYDIMGGSLRISFSNGCCCMKYHLLSRISFRFGIAGWYCVMKGRIHFFALFC